MFTEIIIAHGSCTDKETKSTDDILKYFSDFFEIIGFDISCKLSQGDSLHAYKETV